MKPGEPRNFPSTDGEFSAGSPVTADATGNESTNAMRRYGLSKSRIAAFEQCPKRLWLQVHRPETGVVDPDTQAKFEIGHEVGELARTFYPDGVMVEDETDMRAAL